MINEKEIKKLSRSELVEMIVIQEKENERLKAEFDFVKKQLDDRRILLDNAGSIAEASLAIHNVLNAAQAAADDYLENVRLLAEQSEKNSSQLILDTQQRADELLASTQTRCEQMKVATAQQCEAMLKSAKAESETYWAEVTTKLDEFIRQRTELREFLSKPKSTI